MSKFNRFTTPGTKIKATKTSGTGKVYVDWKDIENLRRMMSPNGKIYGRKRLSTTAAEQRMVAQAVKRARYMSLLPYVAQIG